MFKHLQTLLLLAAGVATTAAATDNGSVDTTWGGLEQGRVRVPFDIGYDNSDTLMQARVLADGRLVTVGTASIVQTERRIAVAVRKADGTADTSIAPNGRYTIPITGSLYSGDAAVIAADGSFYVIASAPDQQHLRVWHYTLNGAAIDAPFDIGANGTRYSPYGAMIDASNRLLIGGTMRPAASAESSNDGFVVRLTSAGAIDPAFGGFRNINFDSGSRDDVVALTAVGETYAVCGRVGDLGDSSNLRFGIAYINRDGSLLNGFNGNGKYVDQLSLNGNIAESPCNSIAAVGSGTSTRLVISGRALAVGEYSRAFFLTVGLDGQVIAGTPKMIDFGSPNVSSNGFPQLLAGRSQGDQDMVYLAGGGTYDSSGRFVVAIARLDSVGNYDTSWGDSATGTRLSMSAPAIGGTSRDLYSARLSMGAGRLHVGATIVLDNGNTDFALFRLTGERIFANGYQ